MDAQLDDWPVPIQSKSWTTYGNPPSVYKSILVLGRQGRPRFNLAFSGQLEDSVMDPDAPVDKKGPNLIPVHFSITGFDETSRYTFVVLEVCIRNWK